MHMGKYKFISKIGSGSHGCVYLVKKYGKLARCVCKTYFQKYNKHAKKELEILKTLNHKNMIKYKNHEKYEKNYFILLEYINYGNLENLMNFFKNKHLSHKPILSIFSQIINGLYYLHRKGIIHRDIKPSKILLSKNSENHLLEA